MQCINPTLVSYDTQGKRIFRSFSIYKKNPLFLNKSDQVFNCGKCLQCRKTKAKELANRCVLHSTLYQKNCFLTLTYDPKLDGYHNNFQYSDVQKLKKRLRKHCKNKKIEIFNVHEYGEQGRKHWHLIVFNHDFEDKKKNPGSKYYNSEQLQKLWPYGHHSIGEVTEASAMYQAQYMEKDFKHGYVTSTKKSHSKHSGIGRPYFLKHYKQILTLGYIPLSGKKMAIPRYFEKLAHKHFSHFYQKENFFDNNQRKALYRPFKKEQPNKELADLYRHYKKVKDLKIIDLSKKWEDVILHFKQTKKIPDFVKSGENALYDLKRKQQKEEF